MLTEKVDSSLPSRGYRALLVANRYILGAKIEPTGNQAEKARIWAKKEGGKTYDVGASRVTAQDGLRFVSRTIRASGIGSVDNNVHAVGSSLRAVGSIGTSQAPNSNRGSFVVCRQGREYFRMYDAEQGRSQEGEYNGGTHAEKRDKKPQVSTSVHTNAKESGSAMSGGTFATHSTWNHYTHDPRELLGTCRGDVRAVVNGETRRVAPAAVSGLQIALSWPGLIPTAGITPIHAL